MEAQPERIDLNLLIEVHLVGRQRSVGVRVFRHVHYCLFLLYVVKAHLVRRPLLR